MSELLPYLQTQLGHAEESEISNAVLVPLPYLRKLIAALEDGERLRTAAERMHEVLGRFFDATHHAAGDHLDWEGATLADLLEPYQELRAALSAQEGRDG